MTLMNGWGNTNKNASEYATERTKISQIVAPAQAYYKPKMHDWIKIWYLCCGFLHWNSLLGLCQKKEVLKFGVTRCDKHETGNFLKVKTVNLTTKEFSSCFRLSPRYTEDIYLFGDVNDKSRSSNLEFWFYPEKDKNYGFIGVGGFLTMFYLTDRGFR